MTEQTKITWDKTAEENFFKILEDIPAMLRPIAEIRVSKKAQATLEAQGRNVIGEKDMVDAFFSETPAGFIPLMKQSMKTLGIDYTKYGHQ